MSIAVLATPSAPPPPPVQPWHGYQVIWNGWDGSVWDLTDWTGSGVLLVEGLTGLHTPQWEDYVRLSPMAPGQSYRGSRTKPRQFDMNLLVYHDSSSAQWVALNDAFWYSMRPDLPGRLDVISPTGRKRSIDLRYTPTQDHEFPQDPAKAGWTLYQPSLTADQPYFYGEWVDLYRWVAPETPELFIPAGGAPPFTITSGFDSAEAGITNLGDVTAWPQIVVEGPLDADVEIDGGMLGLPSVASGQRLVVETDPRIASAVRTVIATGVATDVWAQVIPWDPRPLPIGRDIPLGLTIAGVGSIQVRFRPLYFRGT